MKAAKIKSELQLLIAKETDLHTLEAIKAVLERKDLNPLVEKEMISRALESERDIKEGKVLTIEEAEAKINARLGF